MLILAFVNSSLLDLLSCLLGWFFFVGGLTDFVTHRRVGCNLLHSSQLSLDWQLTERCPAFKQPKRRPSTLSCTFVLLKILGNLQEHGSSRKGGIWKPGAVNRGDLKIVLEVAVCLKFFLSSSWFCIPCGVVHTTSSFSLQGIRQEDWLICQFWFTLTYRTNSLNVIAFRPDFLRVSRVWPHHFTPEYDGSLALTWIKFWFESNSLIDPTIFTAW